MSETPKKSETPQKVSPPHTVELQHPLTLVKGGMITRVTITRLPTLDDLIAIEGLSAFKQQRKGLELLTDLGPNVGKLRTPDFYALSRLVGPLFEADDAEEGSAPSGTSSDDSDVAL